MAASVSVRRRQSESATGITASVSGATLTMPPTMQRKFGGQSYFGQG